MEIEVPIQLVLADPPDGVDFGIQKGSGARYETLFVQRRGRNDIRFRFSITAKDNRNDGLPNFLGPYAQGTPAARFFYVDIGSYAGQKNTVWARRIKVPLQGITWAQIRQVAKNAGQALSTEIPGTGKDGGPTCGTVKDVVWRIARD